MQYNLGPAEGPMILKDTIEIDCLFLFLFFFFLYLQKSKGGTGACAPSSASPVIHGEKEDYSLV